MKEVVTVITAIYHSSIDNCFLDWLLEITPSITGPQLLNFQMQSHLSWLAVSPLRQKSTSSGNLVLAGILAFYAVKTCSKHAIASY